MPENDLYKWFNTTIYYFYVPPFFICSGHLYQKYSKVNSVSSWFKNVVKKAFFSNVNDQIGGLGDTLFLYPTAPYGYLYALFFIFLVTLAFSSVKTAVVEFFLYPNKFIRKVS